MREKFPNSRFYSGQQENAKKTHAFALESDNCGHELHTEIYELVPHVAGRMTDK
jgi:hypothetical protein